MPIDAQRCLPGCWFRGLRHRSGLKGGPKTTVAPDKDEKRPRLYIRARGPRLIH